jgi:hypothetical protein
MRGRSLHGQCQPAWTVLLPSSSGVGGSSAGSGERVAHCICEVELRGARGSWRPFILLGVLGGGGRGPLPGSAPRSWEGGCWLAPTARVQVDQISAQVGGGWAAARSQVLPHTSRFSKKPLLSRSLSSLGSLPHLHVWTLFGFWFTRRAAARRAHGSAPRAPAASADRS